MDIDQLNRAAPVVQVQQHVPGPTKDRVVERTNSALYDEAECEQHQPTASTTARTGFTSTVALEDHHDIIIAKPPMAAKKGVARPAAKPPANKALAIGTPNSKTPATSKRKASATTPSEATGTPTKQKARKSADGKAEGMAVPTTYGEMTEPDRMMWEERKKGKPWIEICARWKEMTGQNPATTTLPNRYTRIKEFIGDFSKEDDKLMMRCKRELEDTWSREIWALTAEQMVVKGGMKYSSGTIERRYKELMADQEPEDVADADDVEAVDEGDGGVIVE